MKDLPERECEECGSTGAVALRYGRETCDRDDDWFGCWSCFSPYWDIRVHGPSGDPSSAPDSGVQAPRTTRQDRLPSLTTDKPSLCNSTTTRTGRPSLRALRLVTTLSQMDKEMKRWIALRAPSVSGGNTPVESERSADN